MAGQREWQLGLLFGGGALAILAWCLEPASAPWVAGLLGILLGLWGFPGSWSPPPSGREEAPCSAPAPDLRQRLEYSLDRSPLLIWMSNQKGDYIYFNQSWLDFTGREQKQEFIQGWRKHVHPEDRKRLKTTHHQAMNVRQPFRLEYRLRRFDGDYRWMQDHGVPSFDKQGHYQGYVGTLASIHELKQTEQALRESEQKYRTIIDTSAEGYWLLSLPDLVIHEVNQTLSRLLGFADYEMLGQPAENFVSPAQRSFFHRQMERLAKHAQQTYEIDLQDRHGELISSQMNVTLQYDELGYPLRIFAFIMDIRVRRQAEQARQAHLDFLQMLMDNIPNPVFYKNEQGVYLGCNRGFEQYVGRSKQYIVGYTAVDLFSPEIAEEHNRADEILKQGRQGQIYESRMVHADGEWRELVIYKTLFQHLEGGLILLGTFYDITERKQAEAALSRTLTEYQAILDNALIGIAFLGEDRRIRQVNRKFEEMFNYSESELLGHSTAFLYANLQDYIRLGEEAYPRLADGGTYCGEVNMKRGNGKLFYCRLLGKAVMPEDISQGFVWSLEDITEQRRAEEELRMAATVFDTSNEAILVTDHENRIITVNPAFTRMTGYRKDEVMGKNPRILSSGQQGEEFYREMWESLLTWGYWQGEIWNRRRNGEVYPEWLSIATIRDQEGRPNRHVAVFSDITKRKQAEEIIRYQANYDALTDLPNRKSFMAALSQGLRLARRNRQTLALMFIDLDKFKEVNDTLGHTAGDYLLQQVAQRLRLSLRDSDTVGRLGGDEFTVLLSHLNRREDAAGIAEKILDKLNAPFQIQGHEVTISASIGIACFPFHGEDMETLLRNADSAMYRVKQRGRDGYAFSESARD